MTLRLLARSGLSSASASRLKRIPCAHGESAAIPGVSCQRLAREISLIYEEDDPVAVLMR